MASSASVVEQNNLQRPSNIVLLQVPSIVFCIAMVKRSLGLDSIKLGCNMKVSNNKRKIGKALPFVQNMSLALQSIANKLSANRADTAMSFIDERLKRSRPLNALSEPETEALKIETACKICSVSSREVS